MTDTPPRKGTPRPNLRAITGRTKPASGIPAGGEGYGGPANGAGATPGIGPTSTQVMDGRARNALISDMAQARVNAAFARIDAVMADDMHPHAFNAAKYVIDRVAGTPAASVTVTEEAPAVTTYRWLPDIEGTPE